MFVYKIEDKNRRRSYDKHEGIFECKATGKGVTIAAEDIQYNNEQVYQHNTSIPINQQISTVTMEKTYTKGWSPKVGLTMY